MSAKIIKMIDEAIEADDVDEIVLDETEVEEFTPELRKKLEAIEGISTLSLNGCSLKSLANFPKLPGLIRLELMNNKFPAGDLKNLAALPELQSLSISDNDVSGVEDLRALANLPLAQLDVSGTALAEQADYREKVFALFKDLQILDNKDKDGNDVEYDEDEEDYDDEEGDEDLDEEDEGFDDDEEEEDGEEDDYDDEDDDEEEDDPKAKKTKK